MGYQPKPKADNPYNPDNLITLTETLIILDITKTESNKRPKPEEAP